MFKLPPKLIIRLGKGVVWCRKCGEEKGLILDDTDPKAFKTWCKGCNQLMTYSLIDYDWSELGVHSLYDELQIRLKG